MTVAADTPAFQPEHVYLAPHPATAAESSTALVQQHPRPQQQSRPRRELQSSTGDAGSGVNSHLAVGGAAASVPGATISLRLFR